MNKESISLMKKINNNVVNVNLNEKDMAILSIACDNSLHKEKFESIESLWVINSKLLKGRIREFYTPQHFYLGKKLHTLPRENKEIHLSFTECFLLKKRLNDMIKDDYSYAETISNTIKEEYIGAVKRLLDKLKRATKGCMYLDKPLNRLVKNDIETVIDVFKEYSKAITIKNAKKIDVNFQLEEFNIPSKYKILLKYLNGTIGSDNQKPIELLKDMVHIAYDNNAYGFEVNTFEQLPRNERDLDESTIAIYYTNLHGYSETEIMFKRKINDLGETPQGYYDISKEEFMQSYNNSVLKEKSILSPQSLITIKDNCDKSIGYSFIKSQILRENPIIPILEKAICEQNEEEMITCLEILQKIADKLKDNINSDCKNLKTENQDIYDIAIKYINRTLCSTNQSIHNLMQDVINVMYDNGGTSAAIILNINSNNRAMVVLERLDDEYEIESIEYLKYNATIDDYDSITNTEFKELYTHAGNIDILIQIPPHLQEKTEYLCEIANTYYDEGCMWRDQYSYCFAAIRGDYARNRYHAELYTNKSIGNLYQGYSKDILDDIIDYMDLKLPKIDI